MSDGHVSTMKLGKGQLVRFSRSAGYGRGKRLWVFVWGLPVWWKPRRELHREGSVFGTAWGWGLLAFGKFEDETDG